MGYELWACGFNAFGQLGFEGELSPEPQDLTEFTSVFKDGEIEILRTTVSSTLLRDSSGLRVAGSPDEITSLALKNQEEELQLVIAGNEKIVESDHDSIIQYDSLTEYQRRNGQRFKEMGEMKQIVANQTSITALASDGKVYTWGDPRYAACLGRDITDQQPAMEPQVIDDLADLPDNIERISSGGYATAALTSSNDVYFWGRPGLPEGLLTGSPTPLDLDGQDFLDVAVGFNHMLLLTTERKLFVVGDGGNGQLGTGVKRVKNWTEVALPLKQCQRIVSIHAGYKNSFVLLEEFT